MSQTRATPSMVVVAASLPPGAIAKPVMIPSCCPILTGVGHEGADVSQSPPSSVVKMNSPSRPKLPFVILPDAPRTSTGSMWSNDQASRSPLSAPTAKQLQEPSTIIEASRTGLGADQTRLFFATSQTASLPAVPNAAICWPSSLKASMTRVSPKSNGLGDNSGAEDFQKCICPVGDADAI